MIGVKKKNSNFSKIKWKEIVFVNPISKIEKVLSEESCCGIRVVMCCSLNCCQHFLRQMIGILKHKFGNKSFEKKFKHTLDFPRMTHSKLLEGLKCESKFKTTEERGIEARSLAHSSLRGIGSCWISGMGLGRADKLHSLTRACTKPTQGG